MFSRRTKSKISNIFESKSPHINSSTAEISIDNIKGVPEVSTAIPSFSASTSSNNQCLPNAASTHDQPNPEILSGFIFDERKHFPFLLQEEDDLTGTQRAEDNYSLLLNSSHCKIQNTHSNESMSQETEQKSATIFFKETLTCGFADQQLEEMPENSICTYCGNDQPKAETKIEFTYAELHAATDGFSKENFLSEGGFGSVYRGRLKNRRWIAVKQHKHASLQGEKEFRSEVRALSKARHENVVMLLGSCSEGSHRLLVYEYVCNRSLDVHLSSKNHLVIVCFPRVTVSLPG